MSFFRSIFKLFDKHTHTPSRCEGRVLHIEGLEERELLSVSALSLEETFLLNSNPGAKHTIYLDFTGHTTPGTGYSWSDANSPGADLVTPAFSIDEDPNFSDAELEMIRNVYLRVAEDYIAFNVNVTTQDPGAAALMKSGGNDDAWGIRVAIGGNCYDWCYTAETAPTGGIAYLGSFSWDRDVPCFIFTENLYNNEKYIAEAITHEVGHTLGLSHDGTTDPPYAYYSGADGWAPIMGTGYYAETVHWSDGSYDFANNREDDLAILTGEILNSYTQSYGGNGFTYREDDHGDGLSTAARMNLVVNTFYETGIIETNADVDVFSFTVTENAALNLEVVSGTRDANLDVLLKLYDAEHALLLTLDPTDAMHVSLDDFQIASGTYYVSVEGTGKILDGRIIYSDYGSIGSYTLSGSVTYFTIPPTFHVAAPEQGELTNDADTCWSFSVEGAADTAIVKWEIDWDDGSEPTEILGGPRNSVEVFHTFQESGRYTINVSVTDILGTVTTARMGPYEVSENLRERDFTGDFVEELDALLDFGNGIFPVVLVLGGEAAGEFLLSEFAEQGRNVGFTGSPGHIVSTAAVLVEVLEVEPDDTALERFDRFERVDVRTHVVTGIDAGSNAGTEVLDVFEDGFVVPIDARLGMIVQRDFDDADFFAHFIDRGQILERRFGIDDADTHFRSPFEGLLVRSGDAERGADATVIDQDRTEKTLLFFIHSRSDISAVLGQSLARKRLDEPTTGLDVLFDRFFESIAVE